MAPIYTKINFGANCAVLALFLSGQCFASDKLQIQNTISKDGENYTRSEKSRTLYDYQTHVVAYKDLTESKCLLEILTTKQSLIARKISNGQIDGLSKNFLTSNELSKRQIYTLAGHRITEFCRGFPTFLIEDLISERQNSEENNFMLNDLPLDDNRKKKRRRRRSVKHNSVTNFNNINNEFNNRKAISKEFYNPDTISAQNDAKIINFKLLFNEILVNNKKTFESNSNFQPKYVKTQETIENINIINEAKRKRATSAYFGDINNIEDDFNIENNGDQLGININQIFARRQKRHNRHYFSGRVRGQTQSQYLNFGNSKESGKAEAESTHNGTKAVVTGSSGMGQAQSQSSPVDCGECYPGFQDQTLQHGSAEIPPERLQRPPYAPEGPGYRPGVPSYPPVGADYRRPSYEPQRPGESPGSLTDIPGRQIPGQKPSGGVTTYPEEIYRRPGAPSLGTPGAEGQIPGGVGQIPGGVGQVPGSAGQIPGGLGQVPGAAGQIPGDVSQIPGGFGRFPGGLGQLPGGLGQLPGGLGQQPGGVGQVPAGEGRIPGGVVQIPSAYPGQQISGFYRPGEIVTYPGTSGRPEEFYNRPREAERPGLPTGPPGGPTFGRPTESVSYPSSGDIYRQPGHNIPILPGSVVTVTPGGTPGGVYGQTMPDTQAPGGIHGRPSEEGRPVGPPGLGIFAPGVTYPGHVIPGGRPGDVKYQPGIPGDLERPSYGTHSEVRYPGIGLPSRGTIGGQTPAVYQPGITGEGQTGGASITRDQGTFGGQLAGQYASQIGHSGRFSGTFQGRYESEGVVGPPTSGGQAPGGYTRQVGIPGQPSFISGVPGGQTSVPGYGYQPEQAGSQPGLPGYDVVRTGTQIAERPSIPGQPAYGTTPGAGGIPSGIPGQPSYLRTPVQTGASGGIPDFGAQPGQQLYGRKAEQGPGGAGYVQTGRIPGYGVQPGIPSLGVGVIPAGQQGYRPGIPSGYVQTGGPGYDVAIPGQYYGPGGAGIPATGQPGAPGYGTSIPGITSIGQAGAPGYGTGYPSQIGIPGSPTGQVGNVGGVPSYPEGAQGHDGIPGYGTGYPGQIGVPGSAPGLVGAVPSYPGGAQGQAGIPGYGTGYPGQIGIPGTAPGQVGVGGAPSYTGDAQWQSRGAGVVSGQVGGNVGVPTYPGSAPGQLVGTGGVPGGQGVPGIQVEGATGQYGGPGEAGQYGGPGKIGGSGYEGQEGGVVPPGQYIRPGAGAVTGSIQGGAYDADSQVQVSVQQSDNDTIASAQAQGQFQGGKSQTQVSGTYSGSGSFSASAGSDDGTRGAQTQISGGKDGAQSSAQGKGGAGQSQAQVTLDAATGDTLSSAQSSGIQHGTQTIVRASEKGGLADAQADGPGKTSSQAQIGFSPYDDNEKDDQKNPFKGGGTAGAQSGTYSGMTQTQIQGKFRFGIKYTGASQAASGSNALRNLTEPVGPFKPINFTYSPGKISPGPSQSQSQKTALNFSPKRESTDLQTAESSQEENETKPIPSVQPGSPLPPDPKTTLENQDSNVSTALAPEDYTESDYIDEEYPDEDTDDETVPSSPSRRNLDTGKDQKSPVIIRDGSIATRQTSEKLEQTHSKAPAISTNTPRKTSNSHQSSSFDQKPTVVSQVSLNQRQHIVLEPSEQLDATVHQSRGSYDERERVYHPGQIIPGGSGYQIPAGFRGKVKSIANGPNTYAIGSNSQAQSVTLSPGSGRVYYRQPAYAVSSKTLKSNGYYGSGYSYQPIYSPVNNHKLKSGSPLENFVSVSKSEAGQKNPYTGKKSPDVYYTQSSSCGMFTNTCVWADGKKNCFPVRKTNPDGSFMNC